MTDQTQTTTEPVAWRIRPKGALGDVMGFQIVTNKYVAQDYSEQPAFEVQPLYTTPQPPAVGLDRDAVAMSAIPAADVPMWADGIVTDGQRVAFAQKSEADCGGFYWACDGGDGCLEWEPTWFIDSACLPAAPTGGRS